MRTVAWLSIIPAAHATDYWMAWPDHYARGGGLGNQLEQIMGRVQCAATGSRRTMVLPDLRADRSSMRGDARHHAFERVFDVGRLRTVANVATWRAMLHDCEHGVSFVVEGDEHKCDAFSPPAAAGLAAGRPPRSRRPNSNQRPCLQRSGYRCEQTQPG